MRQREEGIAILVLASAAILVFVASLDRAEARNLDGRVGKVALFNLVKFKNKGCRSTSTITGSASGSMYRNGTCYTSSECSDKGGSHAGNCASGFGVCCVFLVDTSGDEVRENNTYIHNPGHPSTYGETSSVGHTINKCAEEVCFFRLDFESFTLRGVADTLEHNGGTCLDTFVATVQTNMLVPTICGQNSGQHMYLDVGKAVGDSVGLQFSFSGTSSVRTWDIKVTQVECFNENRPPNGCLQYHTGLTGRFTSFNFPPTDETHLASQHYSVCIRQEAGHCCVNYRACEDQADSFTLSSTAAGNMGKARHNNDCKSDFLGIEASTDACVQRPPFGPFFSKYCGQFFSTFEDGLVNTPVCDCTPPFVVEVFSDVLTDLDAAISDNTLPSRGVCLEWESVACA